MAVGNGRRRIGVRFMDWLTLTCWLLAVLLALGALLRRRLELREHGASLVERAAAKERGSHAARLQHPSIDLTACIGCGACVRACPEDGVLALAHGQAVVVHGARCVGHGRCADACPTNAIALTLGDLSARRDLPAIDTAHEAVGVPGLFLAGEITGFALVRTAVAHGTLVARTVAERCRDAARTSAATTGPRGTNGANGTNDTNGASGTNGKSGTSDTNGANGASGRDDAVDLLVIGLGPAGLACLLAAKERGLAALGVDQATELGGTVAAYPRKKLVMTQPMTLPGHGRLGRLEYTREELVDLWRRLATEHALPTRTGVVVQKIERRDSGFVVTTAAGDELRARHVCLAVGRRGSPQRLGVPGEDLPKVAYSLLDAESYRGRRVLVVGGGDSAIEAALALAEQPGNEVTISYRRAAFARLKARNEARIAAAIATQRVRACFETTVATITPDAVFLQPTGTAARPHAGASSGRGGGGSASGSAGGGARGGGSTSEGAGGHGDGREADGNRSGSGIEAGGGFGSSRSGGREGGNTGVANRSARGGERAGADDRSSGGVATAELELPNDDVFVFAGGTPPFPLLEAAGVSFDPAKRPRDAAPVDRGTGLVVALVVTALGVVGLLALRLWRADYYGLPLALRAASPWHDTLRPGSAFGLASGALAVVLFATNLLYLLRRRPRLGGWLPGSLRAWMNVHVLAGLGACLVATMHSGFAVRDSNGGHALLAMAVVVATGAVGRWLYAFVPRAQNGRQTDLDELGTQVAAIAGEWDRHGRGFGSDVRARVETLVATARLGRGFVARAVGLLRAQWQLRGALRALRRDAVAQGVPANEAGQLTALARRSHRLALQLAHFEEVRGLLATWRWLHRWLALLLLLLVVVHVVTALRFGVAVADWPLPEWLRPRQAGGG